MIFMSNQRKIKLGSKIDTDYHYASKIDFKGDFASQIAKLMLEKKANDKLDLEIKKISKIVNDFTDAKEKNVSYYYLIGKSLSFLDGENFRDIKPYSAYRRIAESIIGIIPGVSEMKVVQKHLDIMYKIGHVDENYLGRVSWDQWYEIMKFKDINENPELLRKVLEECKFTRGGPSLRVKIKEIIKKY